jgi:cytochrome oxidase Cu insertion factor (SCO1/SenC/PrrC family)
MNNKIPYILIALALVAGFFIKDYFDISKATPSTKDAGSQSSSMGNRINDQYKTLLVYPKKNPIVPIELVDADGSIFTNNDFKGYWNLIFSGYTNCPDVCPNTLNQMTQLYNRLNKEQQSKFQFVFLSVDPSRDTPEHLKAYLDFFHPDFVGLTGDVSNIDRIIKSLGGIYSSTKLKANSIPSIILLEYLLLVLRQSVMEL